MPDDAGGVQINGLADLEGRQQGGIAVFYFRFVYRRLYEQNEVSTKKHDGQYPNEMAYYRRHDRSHSYNWNHLLGGY